MTTYAAMLRGIMPSNPNMKNEKLRAVFESLGYTNVRTVISSGNVLFDTDEKSDVAMENKIEKALLTQLGIKSPAFVRSQEEIAQLVKKDPFKGMTHNVKSYLIVSFLKQKPWEVAGVIDTTKSVSPEFMRDIEKKYGKEVTTRTWKTVQRLLAKMV